jgi:glutathionylspermidine synthase
MAITDIGLVNEASADALFVDRAGAPIVCCFKLYPWEWMFSEKFGASPALRNPRWLEPPWKAVLSNKGLLALLWALAPGHPNLLPAYFEDDPRAAELGATYARKPLLSREGANIKLVQSGATIADTAGDYGGEGYVRQALRLLPDFGGVYPVIGSWLVGDQAAGMGVREDSSPVTTNMSRFVPHFILD